MFSLKGNTLFHFPGIVQSGLEKALLQGCLYLVLTMLVTAVFWFGSVHLQEANFASGRRLTHGEMCTLPERLSPTRKIVYVRVCAAQLSFALIKA